MTFQMSVLHCAYLDLLDCGRHVTIFHNFVFIVLTREEMFEVRRDDGEKRLGLVFIILQNVRCDINSGIYKNEIPFCDLWADSRCFHSVKVKETCHI